MKTREIRERLKSMGMEAGTAYVLEAINEQVLQTRRDLTELASYFDKMTETLTGVVTVAERMKERIDRDAAEEDLGPNTNALDKMDS